MTVVTNKEDSLQSLDIPPGHPGAAYVLPALCGEIIYIPCSKSATRLLVTGKETDNAFAVVGTGGAQSPPIGFHYHRQAHDVFLCLKGQVSVWANDKARTLSAGDFASVPPGVVHQYQILGPYTEFIGLIVPGGWEEFFRFIGEPYSTGPLFPLSDPRNPFEVLIPKLKAAAEIFDMIPQPQLPTFDPQPWEETENRLPGALEPYFLKAGTGPKFLVGGTVVQPLATAKESNGRFTIGSIEGSSYFRSSSIFSKIATGQEISFTSTHHCFHVADGYLDFSLSGSKEQTRLGVGETVYIPAGTSFRFDFASKFAKVYVFANGTGIVKLLCSLGKLYPGTIPPETEETWEWDAAKIDGMKELIAFEIR